MSGIETTSIAGTINAIILPETKIFHSIQPTEQPFTKNLKDVTFKLKQSTKPYQKQEIS